MLTTEQREALKDVLRDYKVDAGNGPYYTSRIAILEALLAVSAAPAEGREIVAWRHKWTNSEESGWGYYSAGPQADKLRLGLPGILGRDSGRENWEPLCLATAPTMSEADAKDATRYRWLRAQHEMKEEFEDAEGFVVRETVADAWTVFRPGSVTSLEPVGCIPGELDAAIDAEIERIDRAAAKGESDE